MHNTDDINIKNEIVELLLALKLLKKDPGNEIAMALLDRKSAKLDMMQSCLEADMPSTTSVTTQASLNLLITQRSVIDFEVGPNPILAYCDSKRSDLPPPPVLSISDPKDIAESATPVEEVAAIEVTIPSPITESAPSSSVSVLEVVAVEPDAPNDSAILESDPSSLRNDSDSNSEPSIRKTVYYDSDYEGEKQTEPVEPKVPPSQPISVDVPKTKKSKYKRRKFE